MNCTNYSYSKNFKFIVKLQFLKKIVILFRTILRTIFKKFKIFRLHGKYVTYMYIYANIFKILIPLSENTLWRCDHGVNFFNNFAFLEIVIKNNKRNNDVLRIKI